MQRLHQAEGIGGMEQVRHLLGNAGTLAPRHRLRQGQQALRTLPRLVEQQPTQIALEACPGRLFQYGDMTQNLCPAARPPPPAADGTLPLDP
jgi:hypothetical protein